MELNEQWGNFRLGGGLMEDKRHFERRQKFVRTAKSSGTWWDLAP